MKEDAGDGGSFVQVHGGGADWDLATKRRQASGGSWTVPPALIWALGTLRHTAGLRPRDVLQVGCGTGRTAWYLAARRLNVIGIDISPAAIDVARGRCPETPVARPPAFLVHDVRGGLPLPDAAVDLVVDIFLYTHLADDDVRRTYRRDLARVLRPGGALLCVVDDLEDPVYGRLCEPGRPDGEPGHPDAPVAIVDPELGARRLLFTVDTLRRDIADAFAIDMVWMRSNANNRRSIAALSLGRGRDATPRASLRDRGAA